MNSGQNRLSGLGCTIPLTIACLCAVLLPGAGCSDYSPFTGEYIENERPTVELTSGPVESDSIPYYIHFYWIGDDPDGEIDHYEIAMVSGDPMGFDPQDTTGADKWRISHVTDTLILARADEYDTIVTINRSPYAVHDRMHTFFLRAVDDRGCCSETVHRTFNAWNLAPHVFITQPSNLDNHSGVHMLSTRVHFKWFGKDPIDSPWNYQDVDSTRFLLTRFTPTVVSRLNTDPEEFEDLWSKWEWIDEIEGKGRSTIIGDDEILAVRNTYIFAVQAKDEAGARSSIFDERTNVLRFMVMPPTGPMMEVWEQLLGSWNFMGPGHDPVPMSVPPGYDMTFYWRPNADHYAAMVSSTRYGWDITDLNDPSQWKSLVVLPESEWFRCQPKSFNSGVHTLYIESTDDLGVSTLCIIEVNVISVAMEYPLLWIDDFPSSDFTQETFAFPTETEHDDFWTDICMLVPGFLPARDTYDVAEHGFRPPPLEVVFKYKNIIWTYSSAVDPEGGSIWTRMINYPFQTIFNFIPDYMAYGGHIWTCGSSERTGGMGAVLTMFRIYPSNLECDLLNSSPGCGVPVGMSTMPYKDFCVTVIDKVNAPFKDWIPFRRVLEYDAMSYAALDFNDDFTQQHPGLPQTLTLRDEVTSPGMFFDPDVRGFDRVEIYNPRYWMSFMRIMEQSCFHPMYLIRTRSYRSVLYNQPVAFWTTRHAGVIAPGDRNCAAPSVHFGLPLWYFDSGQVRDIARVIFEEWQILQ